MGLPGRRAATKAPTTAPGTTKAAETTQSAIVPPGNR